MTSASVKRIETNMPPLIVAGLSLYFMVAFGYAGIKGLIVLDGGLPDAGTRVIALAIIHSFALAPWHLVTVWAVIGAAKLAIGGFFMLAALDATGDETPRDRDALDIALHGGIALTLLLLLSSWGSDPAAVRSDLANLMLLCLTVGVSMFDRERESRIETRVAQLEASEAPLAAAKPLGAEQTASV